MGERRYNRFLYYPLDRVWVLRNHARHHDHERDKVTARDNARRIAVDIARLPDLLLGLESHGRA
jgi:hypothetical protein